MLDNRVLKRTSCINYRTGRPLEEIFADFAPTALASASIGQVHKATLLDGTPVVVKVQHPEVDKLLKQDMMTLTQMTWAFNMLERGLNFAPVLEEWQKAAGDELDFRSELKHQTRAREAALVSSKIGDCLHFVGTFLTNMPSNDYGCPNNSELPVQRSKLTC